MGGRTLLLHGGQASETAADSGEPGGDLGAGDDTEVRVVARAGELEMHLDIAGA